MQASIAIRPMMEADIDMINCEFKENGIGTSKAYHKKCWIENQTGERVTLLGFHEGRIAGSLHLLVHSDYPTKEKVEECLKK